MASALTIAPVGGILMKPEAGQRVYWTKVSAGRKYWATTKCELGKSPKSGAFSIPRAPNIEASLIPSSNCRARLPPERIYEAFARYERLVQNSQPIGRELEVGRSHVNSEDRPK